MLKGSNKFELSEATVATAIAEYFNRRITGDRNAIKVVSVRKYSTGTDFVCEVLPREDKSDAKA